MSGDIANCENCGRVLPVAWVDDYFCGESCQADWTRKHWNLPSFADEMRAGYQRFYHIAE